MLQMRILGTGTVLKKLLFCLVVVLIDLLIISFGLLTTAAETDKHSCSWSPIYYMITDIVYGMN